MADARKLTLGDLREIVSDPSELAKGTRVFDEKGLAHLSRFEGKLFADAAGSGSAPYKVQIVFEDKGIRGRCSCMAARTRPFCKHAAGLLVAWARAPESFAEAAGPPEGLEQGAKKRDVKKGKVDAKDIMARGVEQVGTLVRELAVAGVAAMAADRALQVHALGEGLREARLRRVSARTLELAGHLAKAATRSDAFDAGEYAELLADLLLTARKLEKHLAGEPLADEHVEELIGKTWTKKDRKPIVGLDLVEVAFSARVTADEFVIRESRFVDLASGEHFSEKQILPGFLAKRTEPKKSWAGRVLRNASGSLYPTFSPKRVDLESVEEEATLDQASLARLLDKALPHVGAALAALQDRRKDVFAPETLPVALRIESLLADGAEARLRIVDADGAALFLPDDDDVEEALVRVLRDATLEALVGDVALDGALPTFFPLAALVKGGDTRALVALGGPDASVRLASKKLRKEAVTHLGPRAPWIDVARRVGASTAAIALGEVRDEMASALAIGLGSVGPRFAEPIASRLRDLGLVKQADLMSQIAGRADAADKLDDFIKLHQVLGIALTRLAGATHVDRNTLVRVPTYESVHVRAPERALEPREVARLQGAGKMSRWEAAVHYGRHYESLPVELLTESVYPTWADGSAAPFIARAFAKAPEQAIEAARKILETPADMRDYNTYRWYRRVSARMAKLTAVRVLAAVGTPEAKRALLAACTRSDQQYTEWLAAHVQRAVLAMERRPLPAELQQNIESLIRLALAGSQKDDRIHALESLAKLGAVEAIPAMRASFAGDVSADVREAAAFALARVGDVESVETFVRMLRRRGEDPASAKTAAYALGIMGDVRGIDGLLDAYADGWQPGIVAEALREIGPAALEPLVSRLEARPEIAERKAALGVVASMPADDVTALLVARLEPLAGSPELVPRAALYMTIANTNAAIAKVLAARIFLLHPVLLDKKKSSTEEKALARRCAKHRD